jgi:4-hydroxy-3-methylbut-2-enyl diphosphate reductase
MARYACVGVSAGASTPNWIIRDVVEFLEAITPGAGTKFRWKHILEMLAYGNFYIALATALLAQIAEALTDFAGSPAFSFMAAGYAFAMHSLNVYLDQDSIELNDPGKAAFYREWRPVFMFSSALCVSAALILAYRIGLPNFLLMLLLIFLGLLYGVKLFIPAGWENFPVKLKDIPTSKTFFVPMAWAAVCVLPYIAGGYDSSRVIYAGLVIFLLSLVRTTLRDFLAIQGDRLVGKETLVVLAGEKWTALFTVGVLVALVITALCGPLAGVSTGFSFCLIAPALGYGLFLIIGSKRRLREDPLYDVLVEIVLVVAGLSAMVWNLTH